MQVFQDQLIAALIAGVVVLLVGSAYVGNQRANADAMALYNGRTQSLAFIAVMERDFENIGVAGTGQPAILGYNWASGSTRYFEFMTLGDTTAHAPAIRVRYELETATNPACTAAGVSCQRVVRYVHNGSSFVKAGSSAATLTQFRLTLSPTSSDLNAVRTVQVRLDHLTPMGQDEGMQRARWEAAYYPANLAMRDLVP